MARGQRTNLASLATAVGERSAVDQYPSTPAPTAAPLADLTANPRNPRDDIGDLSDLESIADIQLQPAVVVTRAAYLRLYPRDAITTSYVVINGCRRLAAAHKYGRSDLEITVKDAIARDRVTLLAAAISENVDRVDFDVIEEARAVEALVAECGRADDAAERLRKTQSWVSQRRALLKLAPELQSALRAGELAIREARTLARVPMEQQVAKWRAAQDKTAQDNAGEKDKPAADGEAEARRRRARVLVAALREFDTNPEPLANALRDYLGETGVTTLLRVFAKA